MPTTEFPLPYKGFSEGYPTDKTPPEYSPFMSDVRIVDTLEGRFRLCQRPGQEKRYAQQMKSNPIMDICSVTTVAVSSGGSPPLQ